MEFTVKVNGYTEVKVQGDEMHAIPDQQYAEILESGGVVAAFWNVEYVILDTR